MKQLIVVAFLLNVGVVPISQSTRQPSAGVAKEKGSASTQFTPDANYKQQAPETDAISAILTAITKESQERATESQQETAVEQDNSKAIWQNVRAEWWLVWVGIAQTLALIGTLGAIVYQAIKTKEATKAAQTSSKAAEDGIKLQRVAMQQWVKIEKWEMGLRTSDILYYELHFDILNETALPLTVTVISVIGSLTVNQRQEIFLVPKSSHRATALIELTEEQTDQRSKSTFVLNIVTFIFYRDAFEKSQVQVFGKSYALSGTDIVDTPFKGQMPVLLKADEEDGEYQDSS